MTQDTLAGSLLNRSVMESVDRSTADLLRKSGNGTAKTDAQLQDAAKEFEAMFLSHMLTVMRDTIDDSGLTEKGPGQDIYTEMFDQELARNLAKRGALGISDLLMRNLSNQAPAAQLGSVDDAISKATLPSAGSANTGGDEVPDFRMPVQAPLSSGFGIRRDPITHEMQFHHGVDIAAPQGTRIHAAAAGSVVFSGYQNGYGNTVVVQHQDGFETRYAHMGTLLVNAGDSIQASQVLGTVGSTGRSTGAHLHFEISRNGDQIDPKALLGE
ncbi:MAG: peptidoglycan DD-metalloendopeptidase family protein [Acidobacteriota bacterium]|jgi:murein DD-endopeptidase MepM/ murein hydrolase activator NlpD